MEGVFENLPEDCKNCNDDKSLGFEITMAFQPIVNVVDGKIFAYEALVRGSEGESAGWVLSKINEGNMHVFDQVCRVKAVELASKLGLHHIPDCRLSINFLATAVYQPEKCIRSTLQACKIYNFPPERLIFEVSEREKAKNPAHLIEIFNYYRNLGFLTGIDDFGAGYSGLDFFIDFKPDIIKLDMHIIRNIDKDKVRQSIASSLSNVCNSLGIMIIAEGVETEAEKDVLVDMGIVYQQGYLIAKPEIESLPLSKNYLR